MLNCLFRICVLTLLIFAPTLQVAAKTLNGTYSGRSYTVVLPDVTPPKATVFVLHGFKGSGAQVRKSSGFDAWAKRYGVAAVYPNAIGGWNDGRGANAVIPTDQDDVAYLAGLAQTLATNGVIPSATVYAIGISNGGGMAMHLACKNPKGVLGIAVITTKEFVNLDCRAYQPVPAVFFFGTADRLSLHEGDLTGTGGLSRQSKGAALSAQDTIANWRKRNTCDARTQQRNIDRDKADGTRVAHFSFRGCAAPLEYYRIDGGGHTWPGAKAAKRPLAKRILGKTSQDINANAIALDVWFGAPK